MVGIYFSGTDNTKYCLEYFLKQLGLSESAFLIESDGVIKLSNQVMKYYLLILCITLIYQKLCKIENYKLDK